MILGAVRIQHDEELPADIGKKESYISSSVDNQGSKKIAESTGPTKRSKTMEVQHFYVQEKRSESCVLQNYTPTDQMRAGSFVRYIF
jgi:hypothetical protein